MYIPFVGPLTAELTWCARLWTMVQAARPCLPSHLVSFLTAACAAPPSSPLLACYLDGGYIKMKPGRHRSQQHSVRAAATHNYVSVSASSCLWKWGAGEQDIPINKVSLSRKLVSQRSLSRSTPYTTSVALGAADAVCPPPCARRACNPHTA
ncbi:hypothetical protein V8D89_015973 [Ganoderma adspersum]